MKYLAFDGTIFENEYECFCYENEHAKKLSGYKLIDSSGKETNDKDFAWAIVVDGDKGFEKLESDFGEDCCWVTLENGSPQGQRIFFGVQGEDTFIQIPFTALRSYTRYVNGDGQ